MIQPLIILCPLRSFSSLVSSMVGQHPDLYGLPELNLFLEDYVGDLRRHHQRRPHSAHGLLRTLAELHDGEQNTDSIARAREWLERRGDWRTQQLFEYIIDLASPRMVIDKSPSTVMRPAYLQRAIDMVPEGNFLHLTRHPRSTGNSIINLVKRNDEWGGFADVGRIDPEKIWLMNHGNINGLCETLPGGQCMRLRGEDFLAELDVFLPQLCEWLGIRMDAEAIAAMKHPENSPYACIGPEGAELGNDPDFLKNPVFRPGRVSEPSLEGELEWAPGRHFSPETVKLAKEFGYR
jgi:hypothetical protein